jgi:purine-cytosine permease-like protein
MTIRIEHYINTIELAINKRRIEHLMTATMSPPDNSMTDDRVGAVEAAGVEYLPEEARDSSPRNLGAVFLGANLTWTNVVFGAFAILFGLSFWQTVTSMAVGIAVGTLAVLPTAIIGPRTGTNMTVSSGAFFGSCDGIFVTWRR